MRPSTSLRPLIPLLLLAAAAHSQVTVLEGAVGGLRNVVSYPSPGSSGVRLPELQGIALLPVDATGRSPISEFLPNQPRLKNDLGTASRLVLPGAHGCLYRFRRPVSGSQEFGFFVVRPSGLASFLVSVPGTGSGGQDDPIPSPVSVASAGDALLFATTTAAGGDVYEVEIATGVVHLLSGDRPPMSVMTQGLALLPDWGAVLTAGGPLRFTRGGGPLERVKLVPRTARATLGANPPMLGPGGAALVHMGNGFASSADGSTVAMIAGSSAATAHVFAFGASGDSVCVNEDPAAIADPGFGTRGGPCLALSPDGTRAAWKVTGASGECFSREVRLHPAQAEYQITSDLNFTDTLNDTGVIAFFDPNSVVLLVGEANGALGIEKADFYRATFPAGGAAPSFTNLSATSGDTVAPFLEKGTLDTSDGIWRIPGKRGSVFFVSGSSGQGTIYRLNEVNGDVQALRTGVVQVDWAETAGSSFVLQIVDDATLDRELLRVPFDHTLPATSLAVLAPTEVVSSRAGSAAGVFAGLLDVPSGKRLFQIVVATGASQIVPTASVYGPALGFSPGGAALSSLDSSPSTLFLSWKLGGATSVYGSGPLGSVVLPSN